MLFFKPESETTNRLAVINREKLQVEDLYEIEGVFISFYHSYHLKVY